MGNVHTDLLVIMITSIDFYIFVVYELESFPLTEHEYDLYIVICTYIAWSSIHVL